jgi:EAL domain-containing protein (putative c-di-GMP-specific phosphodiesterase class I)
MTIAAVIEKPARVTRVIEVLQELGQFAPQTPGAEPPGDRTTVHQGDVLISCDSIANAICASEMELYLQPIVSSTDGTVSRAEGLIRWHHPASLVISPDHFIPVAERSQKLIDQLTQWVIRAALQKHHVLLEHGLDIQVCINLSGRNLHSLEFPDQLADLLREASAPTDAIGLEVTESAAMHDIKATTDILTRLRLKGFSIAIDDFGTGFSSLDALRQMPFSAIKIDKGFVTGLPKARDSLTIVRSVINLAHDLGLGSVAEGVETQEVAELLTDLGCSSLQGYHFSRPLPIDRFVNWCQSWARTGSRVTTTST